ncbi:hypothetical protein [Vibrio anguillarum]|nr:hypothetical protein [Vibrio anguillarum]AZS26324.1 hypothetical protein DYL72_15560 [Vibrio anguillarum]
MMKKNITITVMALLIVSLGFAYFEWQQIKDTTVGYNQNTETIMTYTELADWLWSLGIATMVGHLYSAIPLWGQFTALFLSALLFSFYVRNKAQKGNWLARNSLTVDVMPVWALLFLYAIMSIVTHYWDKHSIARLFGVTYTDGSMYPKNPLALTETSLMLDHYYWLSLKNFFINEPMSFAVIGVLVMLMIWSAIKSVTLTYQTVYKQSLSLKVLVLLPFAAILALVVGVCYPYRINYKVDELDMEDFESYLNVFKLSHDNKNMILTWYADPSSIFNMLMDRQGTYFGRIFRHHTNHF